LNKRALMKWHTLQTKLARAIGATHVTQPRFALLLPALLLSTSALAGVPNWTMSESSGPVTVASSGMVRAASRGSTLSAGDVISTGAKGRAVIVRGQEYLVVAPNSRIRVADPAQSGGMTQIIEQIGNVVFKIRKMATPHFAVETPFLAAVVKGTTFSVTVTESGASVQVIEGRVEVETRDGGARYLVLPGDIGSVSANALGRLNVQGRETRTIVSPSDGGSVTTPTAELLRADPVAVADKPADSVITVAVGEPPVELRAATDGIVSGALIAAATTMMPVRMAAVIEATPVIDMPPTAAVAAPVAVASVAEVSVPAPIATPLASTGGSNSASNVDSAAPGNDSPGSSAPATSEVAASGSGNSGNGNGMNGSSGNVDTPANSGATDSGASNSNAGSGNGNGGGSAGGNNGNGANGTGNGNNGNGGSGSVDTSAASGAAVSGASNGNAGSRNGNGNGSSGSNNGNGANGTPGGNSGNGVNGTGNGNNGNASNAGSGGNGQSGSGSNGNGSADKGNGNGSSGSNNGNGANGTPGGNSGNGVNGTGNGNNGNASNAGSGGNGQSGSGNNGNGSADKGNGRAK